MAYGVFKDLPRRTTSDKVLHNKAFNFAKNPKYAEYQISLASMVYKFFIKSLLAVLLKLFQVNKAEKVPKPIIRKFKNAIYTLFLKITFGKYSNYNKRFRFLLWFINIFSKLAWVAPLNDKKDIAITEAF